MWCTCIYADTLYTCIRPPLSEHKHRVYHHSLKHAQHEATILCRTRQQHGMYSLVYQRLALIRDTMQHRMRQLIAASGYKSEAAAAASGYTYRTDKLLRRPNNRGSGSKEELKRWPYVNVTELYVTRQCVTTTHEVIYTQEGEGSKKGQQWDVTGNVICTSFNVPVLFIWSCYLKKVLLVALHRNEKYFYYQLYLLTLQCNSALYCESSKAASWL